MQVALLLFYMFLFQGGANMKPLYGLIGEKLNHSLSPQIHSAILRKLDIQAYYHLFEVNRDEIEDAIRGLQALNIRGVNVTIPYKVEVMKYLHQISKEAEKIGAINAILVENHRRIGYNTDYHGLERMVKYYSIPIKNQKAVILGTGGAAKAVLQYLLDHGIGQISMVSRYIEIAALKYQNFNLLSYEKLKKLKSQDIIINCTPLGMYPFIQQSPVQQDIMRNYQWAIDLNYNPTETLFLKYARQEGLKIGSGLFMLVAQAIKAQEIWQKRIIPQEFVEEIYEEISEQVL